MTESGIVKVVCFNMVMRVIDSTSESEVMTPMTRSDEIGRHRSVVGPVEVEATCRFESCLQWVAIFKHTGVWRTLLKTPEGRTLYSVFEYGKVMCYSV